MLLSRDPGVICALNFCGLLVLGRSRFTLLHWTVLFRFLKKTKVLGNDTQWNHFYDTRWIHPWTLCENIHVFEGHSRDYIRRLGIFDLTLFVVERFNATLDNYILVVPAMLLSRDPGVCALNFCAGFAVSDSALLLYCHTRQRYSMKSLLWHAVNPSLGALRKHPCFRRS